MKKLFTAALLSLVAVAGFAQDYDTSTGIDDLTIAKQPTASAKKGVYSLTGVKLSDGNDLSNLPKGIYVVDGKKVMKR